MKEARGNSRPNIRMHTNQQMNRILTTLFVAFLVLSGCAVQSNLDEGPDDVLYFEPIAIGQSGSIRDTLEVVVSDEGALSEALAKVNPLGELPSIDFNQSMVGIIAIPTNSGGFVVEVQSVEQRGEEIQVHYLLSVPGADCITVQALSLPFQIISLRRAQGAFRFLREERRYRCGL